MAVASRLLVPGRRDPPAPFLCVSQKRKSPPKGRGVSRDRENRDTVERKRERDNRAGSGMESRNGNCPESEELDLDIY